MIALEQDKSDSKTVEEILCHGGQSDTGRSSLEQGAHLRKYHFLYSEGSFPWKTLEVTKKIMSLQNSSNIYRKKKILKTSKSPNPSTPWLSISSNCWLIWSPALGSTLLDLELFWRYKNGGKIGDHPELQKRGGGPCCWRIRFNQCDCPILKLEAQTAGGVLHISKCTRLRGSLKCY